MILYANDITKVVDNSDERLFQFVHSYSAANRITQSLGQSGRLCDMIYSDIMSGKAYVYVYLPICSHISINRQ